MSTRSTRAILLLTIGIIIVTNGFAVTGIAISEPTGERGTHVHHGTESIESTASTPESASPSGVLSVGYSTVTSIVLLAGYDRVTGTDPLDHDLREEIHEEIDQSSGTYASALQETCEIPRSTLRYHLDVLEREELIASETIFGQRWYYPSGCDANEVRAALSNDATGELVDVIASFGPVSVTDLADEVERSPSTVSYHLERLEDEGVVERERRSTSVLSRLAPAVRTELDTSEMLDTGGILDTAEERADST